MIMASLKSDETQESQIIHSAHSARWLVNGCRTSADTDGEVFTWDLAQYYGRMNPPGDRTNFPDGVKLHMSNNLATYQAERGHRSGGASILPV